MASVVGIKLLDIFDLNLSRRAASGLTGIKYFYLHMSQNLTGTCLYQIPMNSKDTMIKTFKMPVQHSYKYSRLLVINQLLVNKYWCIQGRQENFWAPVQKETWPPSSNSPNNDTQTKSTTVCHKQGISTTKMDL